MHCALDVSQVRFNITTSCNVGASLAKAECASVDKSMRNDANKHTFCQHTMLFMYIKFCCFNHRVVTVVAYKLESQSL